MHQGNGCGARGYGGRGYGGRGYGGRGYGNHHGGRGGCFNRSGPNCLPDGIVPFKTPYYDEATCTVEVKFRQSATNYRKHSVFKFTDSSNLDSLFRAIFDFKCHCSASLLWA